MVTVLVSVVILVSSEHRLFASTDAAMSNELLLCLFLRLYRGCISGLMSPPSSASRASSKGARDALRLSGVSGTGMLVSGDCEPPFSVARWEVVDTVLSSMGST